MTMSCATERPGGKQGSVKLDLNYSLTTLVFGASLLVFLWWRLIDHLRVEWSSDEQYAYGWAVPFLCAYLCWHGARHGSASQATTRIPTAGRITPVLAGLALALLALAYLPIRLLQEASPEWRLVSWALALVVVGVTLLLLPALLDVTKKFPSESQDRHHT
jgi:hypothetical protein